MTTARLSRFAACTALALLLASCALLQRDAEPPDVELEGIRIVSVSQQAQRYAVTLRVFNPNRFDVPIRDLVYRLDLNGEAFASGRLEPGPTLPAQQAVSVELMFDTDLATTTRRLMTWFMRGEPRLDYRLTGEARIRRLGVPTLRFDEDGTIALDALRPR
jgi:LEA14-like dessication related protein